MEEEIVSFQVAKLAKEKGFNWKCLSYYSGFNLYSYTTKDHNNETIGDTPMHIRNADYYSAPTQSLLQKWLREVHNIFVYPVAVFPIGYETVSYYDVGFRGHHLMQRFESWEEAFEYALVYGLNKIKNEK